jgi:hypothetical protein
MFEDGNTHLRTRPPSVDDAKPIDLWQQRVPPRFDRLGYLSSPTVRVRAGRLGQPPTTSPSILTEHATRRNGPRVMSRLVVGVNVRFIGLDVRSDFWRLVG